MKVFYSKTTGGFYQDDIHADMPADVVEITDEIRWQLIGEESQGKLIVPDADGKPIAIDPPAPDLATLKAQKNDEINRARMKSNTSNFTHDGKEFACDALSRSDIDGVNGYVAIFGILPSDFPKAWKATDNTLYPIPDVDTWKGFYTSMVSVGTTNFIHSQMLKAQLAAATTAEQVAAIVW